MKYLEEFSDDEDRKIKYNELLYKDKHLNTIKTEDVQLIIPIKQQHFKKGEFLTMKTDFLFNIIFKYDLKLLDLKVLAYFMKNIEFNNRIKNFTQNIVANDINSTQQNISKTIKRLEEKDIIYKKELNYYFSERFIKFAGDKN